VKNEAMTITIEDPAHQRLRPGATIRVGNNDELKREGLGTMPGLWEVTYVYSAEQGRQRYDVVPAAINRHQLRARLKKIAKGNFKRG